MSQASDLLWYIVWLTVIGVAAMVMALLVARTVKQRMDSNGRGAAFTIRDLRRMRAAGSITPAEYEAMRAALVGRIEADVSPADERRSDQPSGGEAPGEDRDDRPSEHGADDRPD